MSPVGVVSGVADQGHSLQFKVRVVAIGVVSVSRSVSSVVALPGRFNREYITILYDSKLDVASLLLAHSRNIITEMPA